MPEASLPKVDDTLRLSTDTMVVTMMGNADIAAFFDTKSVMKGPVKPLPGGWRKQGA